jgi:hypothetical protein
MRSLVPQAAPERALPVSEGRVGAPMAVRW